MNSYTNIIIIIIFYILAINISKCEKSEQLTKLIDHQKISEGIYKFQNESDQIFSKAKPYVIKQISQQLWSLAYSKESSSNGIESQQHLINVSENFELTVGPNLFPSSPGDQMYTTTCKIGENLIFFAWTDENGYLKGQVVDNLGNITQGPYIIDQTEYNWDVKCTSQINQDTGYENVIYLVYVKKTSTDLGDIFVKVIHQDGTDFNLFTSSQASNPFKVNVFTSISDQIRPYIIALKNQQIVITWEHNNFGQSQQIFLSVFQKDMEKTNIEEKRIYDGYDLSYEQTQDVLMFTASAYYNDNIFNFGFRESNLNRPIFPYTTEEGQGQINSDENGEFSQSSISTFQDNTYFISFIKEIQGKKLLYGRMYKNYNVPKQIENKIYEDETKNIIDPQSMVLIAEDKKFLTTYIEEETSILYVTAYFYPDLVECPVTCKKCSTIENYGEVCSKCENKYFDKDTDCLECIPGFKISTEGKCICEQNGFYDDENGQCIECGRYSHGNDLGGCECDLGMEYSKQNGLCVPSFSFGTLKGEFDGQGEYGEAWSKRIQTPPGEVNSETLFIMGGAILGSLLMCCCYLKFEHYLFKRKRKHTGLKNMLRRMKDQHDTQQDQPHDIQLKDLKLFKGIVNSKNDVTQCINNEDGEDVEINSSDKKIENYTGIQIEENPKNKQIKQDKFQEEQNSPSNINSNILQNMTQEDEQTYHQDSQKNLKQSKEIEIQSPNNQIVNNQKQSVKKNYNSNNQGDQINIHDDYIEQNINNHQESTQIFQNSIQTPIDTNPKNTNNNNFNFNKEKENSQDNIVEKSNNINNYTNDNLSPRNNSNSTINNDQNQKLLQNQNQSNDQNKVQPENQIQDDKINNNSTNDIKKQNNINNGKFKKIKNKQFDLSTNNFIQDQYQKEDLLISQENEQKQIQQNNKEQQINQNQENIQSKDIDKQNNSLLKSQSIEIQKEKEIQQQQKIYNQQDILQPDYDLHPDKDDTEEIEFKKDGTAIANFEQFEQDANLDIEKKNQSILNTQNSQKLTEQTPNNQQTIVEKQSTQNLKLYNPEDFGDDFNPADFDEDEDNDGYGDEYD